MRYDSDRLDQRRGDGARPGRAIRASSGSSRETDRRARPARPAWASPPGNLAASLLLIGSVQPARRRDARLRRRRRAARRRSRPSHRAASFRLKWPNDLLARRRQARRHPARGRDRRTGSKRSSSSASASTSATSPREMPYPATSLAELGHADRRRDGFRGLVGQLGRRRAPLGRGARLRRDPRRWLAGAAGLGRDIAVRIGADACAARSRPSTTPASSSCVRRTARPRHRRRRCPFRRAADRRELASDARQSSPVAPWRASKSTRRCSVQPSVAVEARASLVAPQHAGIEAAQRDRAPEP